MTSSMESEIEDQELEHVYDANGSQIRANKERVKEKVQCGNNYHYRINI